MTVDATHVLRRQTVAAVRLLENLREIGVADDEELVADTIEGETGLHEAISRVMVEIDECEVHVTGLTAKEEQFARRREAFAKRRELLKAAVERAMIEAESPSIKLDTGTVYLTKRAPNVVIESEADVPARFWKQPPAPEPKIDKSSLKEALKAGEEIAGARLDNGSVSLNLRR